MLQATVKKKVSNALKDSNARNSKWSFSLISRRFRQVLALGGSLIFVRMLGIKIRNLLKCIREINIKVPKLILEIKVLFLVN
jgi:hypothetical protein